DHPQPRRRREELGRDLGGAPHRQRVVGAGDLAQLGRLEADADVDLPVRDPLEDGLRLRRQIVGDEDAHQRPPANDCWAAARPARAMRSWRAKTFSRPSARNMASDSSRPSTSAMAGVQAVWFFRWLSRSRLTSK